MTSIGIIVGTATIVMVIAIGRGGRMDVSDQFKNLNAGAIDITYDGGIQFIDGLGGDMEGEGFVAISSEGGNAKAEGFPSVIDQDMLTDGGDFSGEVPGAPGLLPEIGSSSQKQVILSDSDVEDIEIFVPGISEATISYSTRSDVNGGNLEAATSYTIAGVKENYASVSNLKLAAGSFIEENDDENKQKVCVLGASVAKEIFGDVMSAYDSTLYIGGQAYVVSGVLEPMGTVSSGISPDDTIFVPYATGIKYITGEWISPTITVLAEDVTAVDSTIEKLKSVLAENYADTEFTYTDAGSKMEAANKSNRILTMLLTAMAAIVFLVGGIGIMNVLFVSVKERTGEIGILKAIGCSRRDILLEFLMEAASISLIGGMFGIILSLLADPIVTYFGVRVEMTGYAWGIALVFAVGTGTVFGFYPALKASRLLPVLALRQE